MHTAVEMISLEDLESSAKLLGALALDLGKESVSQ